MRLRSFGWTPEASSGASSACSVAAPRSVELGLDLGAHGRRDRRPQLELGQRGAHVEAGAADDDRPAPLREQAIDLGMRELREAAGRELLVDADDSEQPVLESSLLAAVRRRR